jgi:DtxR family transcriptional regulator, Mn-dependent transcriptional regulator
MREQLTQSVEDYLKIIYLLTAEFGRASTTQIAEHLGVKPGSVTGMLQKMAETDPALVEYQKHRGAVLTPQGEQAALEMIRHHRLLELFLYKTLGYTWDEVHGEADRLEHVISEEFEERIAQALGDPTRDPHGEPIPTRDFRLPPQSSLRLSDLRPGNRARVQRVDSADEKLLRYLSEIGLVPQAQVNILDYSTFDDNLRIQVGARAEPIVLGPRVTSQIFMEDFYER